MNQTRATHPDSSRRRLLELTATAIVVIGFFAACIQPEPSSVDRASVRQVRVDVGDSLWTLAREHGPEGVATQGLVQDIVALNGLGKKPLKPGSVIAVPVDDGDRATTMAMR